MYKMHQCALCSVYLGKAKHHVVYDRNHFFGFGPIPKLITKMADTFMPKPYLIKGPKIKDAAKWQEAVKARVEGRALQKKLRPKAE